MKNMNKNKLLLFKQTKAWIKTAILSIILILIAATVLPANAKGLPKRFSLILQYTITGNLKQSGNIICPYSFTRNLRSTKKSYIYKAVDCKGKKHSVFLEVKNGNIFIGIPLYPVSVISDGFNILISETNVGFPCNGTIQPSGFISGTCNATKDLSGTTFLFSGTFTATPG